MYLFNTKLKKELESAKKAIATLDESHKKTLQENAILEERNRDLKSTICDLNAENKELKDGIEEQGKKIAALVEENAALRLNNTSLKINLNATKHEAVQTPKKTTAKKDVAVEKSDEKKSTGKADDKKLTATTKKKAVAVAKKSTRK